MRRTVLWNEKEPSPEFHTPKVTRFGKAASMKQKKNCNLARSKRFSQYDIDANRVGRNVGPGSYKQANYCISASISQTPRGAKYFYRHEDRLNNVHYFFDQSNTKPNFLKAMTQRS